MNSAVLLIAFNRPENTQKVFDAIRKAKPHKLYFAVDAPGNNNTEDEKNVFKVKEIIKLVDWDCEVHKRFTEVNQGCAIGVSKALSWAFEHEDRLIILEDDCVPSQSFFYYCYELLERYKDDTRIWLISGNQFNEEAVTTPHSYFFSKYGHTWGWATWKRCWQEYDIKMKKYPLLLKQNLLASLFRTKQESLYFNKFYEYYYNNSEKVDTWDYQFDFALAINSYLSIVPAKNLVKNIGHTGTHYEGKGKFHNRSIDENYKIISHPDFVLCDVNYDAYHFKHHWNKKTPIIKRILRKIKRILNKSEIL